MNRTLLVTALLAAFTAFLHTIGGTLEIHSPLLKSALAPEISLLLYACWHLVSVTLFISACAFFIAAKQVQQNQVLAKVIGCMWVGFGIVFIVVDLVFAGLPMLFVLPQWVLLIPVGALGLWGAKRAEARHSS